MIFHFTNSPGYQMVARLVRVGERYGNNGCLTADDPLIEFYEVSDHNHNDWLKKMYSLDHNLYLINNYNLDTFLFGWSLDGGAMRRGICLDGSQPRYNLTAGECQAVVANLFMESLR